ncbi:MAG: T9SS type A sorting domain-containing protein [Crocinitomicaceae bacterium]|nr:T9SS type A sorting domain-containing protein [Crocinitomicaceae bacterium]
MSQSTQNTFYFAEVSEANNVVIAGGIRATKSVDGGYTWGEMPLGNLALPFATYSYYGAAIVSPSVYCMIGKDNTNHRSNIIRTIDGGSTWISVLQSPTGSYNYFTNIVYNGNVILVTAKNGIYRSVNDGLTWTFVAVASATSKCLQYNQTSSDWVINHSFNYYVSSDDGLTWVLNSAISSTSSTNLSIEQNNNNLLILHGGATINDRLYLIDDNYIGLDTLLIPGVALQNDPIRKSYYLPSADVIASSYAFFIKIDTLTGNFYFYNHNLVDPGTSDLVVTNDFDFDQTFGIAVGEYGGLSRFDASAQEDFYLPATFTLQSTACPGDTIFAEPDFPYSDSLQWYYDGNLVSTNTSLEYLTPYIFGQFDLVLNNWYDGNLRSDTLQLNFAPLIDAPSVSVAIDTTPCFNDAVTADITFDSGNWWFCSQDVWLNDVLLSSMTAPNSPSSSYSIATPIIATEDTLTIISDYPQQCGTTYDTVSFILYPGDDLSDNFALVSANEVCIDMNNTTPVQFEVTGTNSTCEYEVEVTSSISGGLWWTESYPGISNNTLINADVSTLYFSEDYFDTPPQVSTFQYFSVSISDDNYCSVNDIPIDTIEFFNPRAHFFTYSNAFYRNDTIEITNLNIEDNRLWSATPSGLTVNNSSFVEPTIFGDTTGIYSISLINSPLLGCSDTMSHEIYYSDSLPVITQDSCWTEDVDLVGVMMKMVVDQEGNIFELGVFDAHTGNSQSPGFHLTKRAPDGTILWAKKSNMMTSSSDFYGAVIADIDVDENGDVFGALWIRSEATYNYELINYGSNSDAGNFLFKLDGQTGDMLWFKNLSWFPISLNASTKVTDVLTTDDRIYITTAESYGFDIYSTDLNGNYITQDFVYGSAGFMKRDYLLGSNNNTSYAAHLSPQMIEMSTGEILIGAWYQGNANYAGTLLPELSSFRTDAFGTQHKTPSILVVKYTENDGFYDFKKLATTPIYSAGTAPMGEPFFDLDEDDNIIVGFDYRDAEGPVMVLDSVLNTEKGTCIFQVGPDYDLHWLNTGTVTEINDLHVAKGTGEIFVTGNTARNSAFWSADNCVMLGEDGEFPTQYGTTIYGWDLFEHDFDIDDIYTIIIDTTGAITQGEFVDVESTSSWTNIRSKLAVTPCSDLYTAYTFYYSNNSTLFTAPNWSTTVDSSFTRKTANNCSTLCTYATINYDTLFVCGLEDSIYVEFAYSTNVDSVNYTLLENGIPTGIYTVSTNGSGFYASLPNFTSDFSIEINSPLQTSFVVYEISPPVPTYNYQDTICSGDSLQFSASPASNSYLWNNSTTGINYTLNNSGYSAGTNYLHVQAEANNGCILQDSLLFYVYPHVDDTIAANYFVACGDTLSVVFNENNFVSQSWTIAGSPATNEFHGGNLNNFSNDVAVTLTDPNGCTHTTDFNIHYCYNLGIDTSLDEDQTIHIYPNPSQRLFHIELLNERTIESVRITNILGVLVYEARDIHKDALVVIIDNDPGMYILEVKTESYEFFKAQLIKH